MQLDCLWRNGRVERKRRNSYDLCINLNLFFLGVARNVAQDELPLANCSPKPRPQSSRPHHIIHDCTHSKIGGVISRGCSGSANMPRGKKKATVAEAPPSSPPPAKKRRSSSNSTPKGGIIVSSAEVKGTKIQETLRGVNRNSKTYIPVIHLTNRRNTKRTKNKNLNVGSLNISLTAGLGSGTM